MVRTQVFTHSLSLALRVVDTTTGKNIPGRELTVRADGDVVRFAEKDNGVLAFQNLPPGAFRLEVSSPYYERAEREVDLDALDKGLPLLELQMIPDKAPPGMAELEEAAGRLPGIREIDAVSASDNSCFIQEFDQRKRIVKLFNPHHLVLERFAYAVVDPEQNCYERFRIVKQLNDQAIQIDRVLEMPFRNSFPVTPVVTGRCGPEGSYRLCVRREMGGARWLIRWATEEKTSFRLVDFRDTPHPRLE